MQLPHRAPPRRLQQVQAESLGSLSCSPQWRRMPGRAARARALRAAGGCGASAPGPPPRPASSLRPAQGCQVGDASRAVAISPPLLSIMLKFPLLGLTRQTSGLQMPQTSLVLCKLHHCQGMRGAVCAQHDACAPATETASTLLCPHGAPPELSAFPCCDPKTRCAARQACGSARRCWGTTWRWSARRARSTAPI
jgi:hypothetical protein